VDRRITWQHTEEVYQHDKQHASFTLQNTKRNHLGGVSLQDGAWCWWWQGPKDADGVEVRPLTFVRKATKALSLKKPVSQGLLEAVKAVYAEDGPYGGPKPEEPYKLPDAGTVF
jgi:hypothetical protein